MGDVISITDAQGNELVQYEYDEWGKNISVATTNSTEEEITIANANPLRYRGYYYDTETGYYYLQSRYYDPSICRFINADIPEIANISKDIPVGTNSFAYCNNNPVNNSDPNGKITLANAIGALIGLVVGLVGGYFLSGWIADKLGLKGTKRKIFIAGITAVITASAAAIGYFIGPYAVKLSQKNSILCCAVYKKRTISYRPIINSCSKSFKNRFHYKQIFNKECK